MPYTINTAGSTIGGKVFYYHNQAAGFPNETQWGTAADPLYPTSPNPPGVINPGFTCNSREVVIQKIHSNHDYFPGYLGQPWEIYVTMPIGSHLWRTSGPMLVVQPQ